MKKLLIVHTNYQNKGGEDIAVEKEISFLKRNYEVKTLIFSNDIENIFHQILSFLLNKNNKSMKKLNSLLDEFNPDIVYVHNTWFKANLGIFKILNKKTDITVLNKIHNLRHECSRHFMAKDHFKENDNCPACANSRISMKFFNKYYKESWLKSLFLWHYSKNYIKILKKYRMKILVLNNFHKEYLYNLGVARNKIYSFHNPIGQLNYSFNPNSDYVIYAGRVNNSKGIADLISAWADSNIEGLQLKVIGEGELLNKLETEATPNISFLGALDNTKTKEYIKSARAVITATKMYEGQPRLLSEAASFGIPSIYPSFGGMDEYFPEDYSYKFKQFNYEDLIKKIRLLENKNLLEKESKSIFIYTTKKFNEENTINLFKRIIMD